MTMNGEQSTMNKKSFKPKCMATAIGSMPQKDPRLACKLVLENLKEAPIWPQLPKRSYKENMYLQFSEGMPSLVLNEEEQSAIFKNGSEDLETFYQKYLDEDLEYFAISKDYAAGFYEMLDLLAEKECRPVVIKGQVTGPISFGLSLKDSSGKSILFNEAYSDAVTKCLAMKAKWQEKKLKEKLPKSKTLIFFDEPYLVSFGSAFLSLSKETVIDKLQECFSAVEGLKGIHICGGTDWSMIMETDVDVIHFDAYEYFKSFALYPAELNAFLEKGGMVGWGIIPHSALVMEEDASSILDKFEVKIRKLTESGIDETKLLEQSFISPSCGAGAMTQEEATRALELAREVSELLRK